MIRKRLILLFFLIFSFLIVSRSFVFAADEQRLGCGGGFGPIAQFFCGMTEPDPAKQNIQVGNKVNAVFSTILGFLTTLAAIWFMIRIVLAGFSWISAGGDKGKLEEARNKLLNAVLGFAIVVIAWVLIGIIGAVLGVEILNPGSILQDLIIK